MNKTYLLEITTHGKYALWQSVILQDDVLISTLISKPVGEKSSAIYTKDDQGLVLIEKDFCVIEAIAQDNKIIEISINKVFEIIDNVASTKMLYEFKNGKWDNSPPMFFQKAINTCTFNAQNPNGKLEYFTINQKISFYRNYQKQCG